MAATAEQLRKEIKGLKKFLPLKYYLLFLLIYLVLGFFIESLFTMLIDKISFRHYLDNYSWQKLVWNGAFWFGFAMLFRRYQQKAVRKKEVELQKITASI